MLVYWAHEFAFRSRILANFLARLPHDVSAVAGHGAFRCGLRLTAKASGLSLWETQLMSLTTFAGASQFAAAGMLGSGASVVGIVFTTFLLNARHVLYGMSLSRQLPLTRAQRPLAAQFLTDEAYGMVIVNGPKDLGGLSFPFLMGAELSLYSIWNASTLLGSVAGAALPNPEALGVGVIFPLAFLGLLVPLLVDRISLLVAVVSGLGAWLLSRMLPGGLVILLALRVRWGRVARWGDRKTS